MDLEMALLCVEMLKPQLDPIIDAAMRYRKEHQASEEEVIELTVKLGLPDPNLQKPKGLWSRLFSAAPAPPISTIHRPNPSYQHLAERRNE